ncbi:MAG: amidase, partial [Pseudomonadota bacterium]
MLENRVTATAIIDRHLNGEASCVETVSEIFANLPAVQSACNAFTEWFEEEAIEQARILDEKAKPSGKAGRLHGVPVCIKDMTPTKGHHTTLGSWSSGEGRTNYDAVIVQRLKAAGAIIVGKTTTAELAFSSFTNTKRYGVTRNPWNRLHTTGGSSGGSAAVVASGLVPLAEGTDMGGSVRIPAAACGIVGFKPSLGRIPMDIVPSSLETYSHFGPLAACIADTVLFVDVTSGAHPVDALSSRPAFRREVADLAPVSGKKIALSIDLGYCAVDPEVEAGLRKAVETLADHGVIVEEVELPWTREVFDQWCVRWNCLLALFPNTNTSVEKSKMDPELVECIETGRATSAIDLLKVDVLRKQLNAQLGAILSEYDALICPTNAVPAPLAEQTDASFGDTLPDGKMRAFDMAHPFNMVPSCPALSLPVGLTEQRLPIGMQIVGKPFEDEALLSLAASIEAL